MRLVVTTLVWIPLVASCGLWSSGPSVSVRIDPRLIGTHAPESRTEYNCYLVNVSGPGISPTVGESAIGYYAPECLKLGVSSRMVSGEVLAQNGVRFSIAAGAARTIQVLGVVTSLGAQCENSEISKLFENEKKPELYQLASRQVDLLKDAKVAFTEADVIPNPENLLSACTTTKTDYDPANLTAVQIVTRNGDTFAELENFTLGEDGQLAKVQTINVPSVISHGLATRDSSRAIYWNTAGNAFQYLMGQPGVLAPHGLFRLTHPTAL